MSGKSYNINHATNTASIKDHSFRSFIKLLALAALTFFIVTVLILCWLNRSNGIEPKSNTTTENYGAQDKVIQGAVKVSNVGTNRRIKSTTPRPIFDRTPYQYIPSSNDAHLHGPDIDDPLRDDNDSVYDDNTPEHETDILENKTTITLRNMDVRFDVIKVTTTEDTNKAITHKNITTSTSEPIKSQRLLAVLAPPTTTVSIENITTTTPISSELEATTTEIAYTSPVIAANETTTEYNIPPQTSTLADMLDVNRNSTTISVPTCPSIPSIIPKCPTPLPVCETVECKKSASKILSLINHESDPCDNFYAFTCSGSHLNKVDLNSEMYEDDDIYGIDLSKLDSNVQYMKIYKRFYKSCVDYDKNVELPLLQKHMKEIHIENVTLTDKASKLADLLADILKFGVRGSTSKTIPIVDIVMDADPNGKFIPVITIPMDKSPILEAGDGDFYEKYCLTFTEVRSKEIDEVDKIYEIFEDCMQNHTLYETVLQKSIEKLRLFSELSEYDSKQKAGKIITDVMWDIIDEIGAVSKVDKIKLADMYDPVYYSLSDLQIQHPEINWQRLFTAVFNNLSFVFDKVKVMYPSYLKKIFDFYKKNDFDKIKSSLLAMIAHDFYIEYLSGSVLARGAARKPFCSKLTINTMKEISTKVLVNQYSEQQITFKEKMAEKIFLESKASFSESIGNSSWLSSGEKELFLHKVKHIKMFAKSTEMYKDPNKMAQLYADIDIQDSLVHNSLVMMKFSRKSMYDLMSKDFLENQYFWTYLASPLEKSARAIIELNTIIVPFRLLSRSISNAHKMKQKYEIYSKLSFEISSELASFFSPTNIRKFWTERNEVYKTFANINLIDPYITQIANQYDLEMDKNVIKYTLNSRFNDDAAIRNAWETYRWKSLNTDLPLPWLNLTIPQLFYVTFAQQFCHIEPNRVKTSIDMVQSDKLQNYFRLNSVIMNSKNFPEEFECNRGTNMHPSLKIEQFPHIFDAESYDEDITDNTT